MTPENLSALTQQQLLKKLKVISNNKIIDAVIVGVTIGVVIYSFIKHGLGVFTFFPLVLAYLITRNSENNKALEKEIHRELQSRENL